MIVILVLISGSIYAILCFCGLNLYLKISTCGRALVDFAVLTLSKYGNQIHCLGWVSDISECLCNICSFCFLTLFSMFTMFAVHFVPNLTIGAPVIESLRKHTKAYLDCHLMVTNPLDYVEALAKAGASGFTFHIEVSKDNWRELIQSIKTKGMRPGVSLKPGTPIEEVYALVEDENPVEMVLIMTVEPGFGGQKFMPEMMDKVRALRKKYPSLDIEVDGGLGPSTIEMAASAGANCIVAGSSIFGAAEPAKVIAILRESVASPRVHRPVVGDLRFLLLLYVVELLPLISSLVRFDPALASIGQWI
ncbi:hypothetical protein J5N97_025119 [Dioscorea zingiberensis]|uniref:ribulose-phosphate 3-epimerase n=1 Tax=Dioscorea zingiberensis TaxID=325984 RepID=A0A9D5C9A2_9LILI|nr:hypothetical protein J5N97_025119 [Dioscorea zingiberensis]